MKYTSKQISLVALLVVEHFAKLCLATFFHFGYRLGPLDHSVFSQNLRPMQTLNVCLLSKENEIAALFFTVLEFEYFSCDSDFT